MNQTRLATLMIIGCLIFTAIALAGCANMLASSTQAHYIVRPDGTKEVFYESNKDTTGLDATFDGVHVQVDKAGTSEAVIAAVLQVQNRLLNELIPLLRAQSLGAGS